MTQIDNQGTLSETFFQDLTQRQEALFGVLADSGEWVLGPELRKRMRDRHNVLMDESGQALAGVISGITQKYSESERDALLQRRWAETDVEFRIGEYRIQEAHRDQIRDRLSK